MNSASVPTFRVVTPTYPITLRGQDFEVRHLNGVRLILRKGKRQHCWHFASPQIATMVAAAYDRGMNTPVLECVA